MKKEFKLFAATGIVLAIILVFSFESHAQLRKDLNRASDLSGQIIKKPDPSDGANLGNLFNMQMSHSYSMNFASFGGQFQNINAYTNTMRFFFSEDLTGRVDLQLLHSPFGNSGFLPNNSSGMDMQFRVRNAELNYQISDNSNISIHFQQGPAYGYGMNPWTGNSLYNPFSSSYRDQFLY